MFNDLTSWCAPGITNPEARHKFALNTCNGCHSSQETNTAFLMVFPRAPGQEARLSPFLTGTTTFDPVTGPRVLNDLRRRNLDMRQFACPGEPLPPSRHRPRPDGGWTPPGPGRRRARAMTMPPPPRRRSDAGAATAHAARAPAASRAARTPPRPRAARWTRRWPRSRHCAAGSGGCTSRDRAKRGNPTTSTIVRHRA